ncbi:MAG: CPXCG motif-containing cysteine-rich protein [Oligoflexia bacterium]
MESNYQVTCPYCWEQVRVEFFAEDGEHQETVVDCEVCCNPVLYLVSFEGEKARVRVERAQD